MVGVLIDLRRTMLRRSLHGTQGYNVGFGALCGLAGAVGMIWLVTLGTPARAGDLLTLALVSTLVGWLAGPALSGGGDLGIRREHLALLPVRRRDLILGLYGAALTGVGPAVTLVSSAALVVYGARLGVVPALVGVPAAILHGTEDVQVPVAVARRYAQAAQDAGDPVSLHVIDGEDHFAFLDTASRSWALTRELLIG